MTQPCLYPIPDGGVLPYIILMQRLAQRTCRNTKIEALQEQLAEVRPSLQYFGEHIAKCGVSRRGILLRRQQASILVCPVDTQMLKFGAQMAGTSSLEAS